MRQFKLKVVFDVHSIVETGGLFIIALMIFAESGMFIGFFFPGDTLLITAGVFAAQGHLPLATTIAVVAVAAIVGDNTGYHIGRIYGPKLFKKPDGLIFRQEYVQKAEKFYERWGSRTMLFSHFVPIVRTFAPPVAGVAKMKYREFFIFDAIGIIAWSFIVTMVGYWFGTKIPNIDRYIIFAVLLAMTITLGPTIYHLLKALSEKKRSKK